MDNKEEKNNRDKENEANVLTMECEWKFMEVQYWYLRATIFQYMAGKGEVSNLNVNF